MDMTHKAQYVEISAKSLQWLLTSRAWSSKGKRYRKDFNINRLFTIEDEQGYIVFTSRVKSLVEARFAQVDATKYSICEYEYKKQLPVPYSRRFDK